MGILDQPMMLLDWQTVFYPKKWWAIGQTKRGASNLERKNEKAEHFGAQAQQGERRGGKWEQRRGITTDFKHQMKR